MTVTPPTRTGGLIAARRGARVMIMLALATPCLPAVVLAGALEALDADVRACAERALPRLSMVQKQAVKVISDDGWVRSSSRTMYWKRFADETVKMLFVVDKPLAEAGLKVLISKHRDHDPVIHVYTPDTRRARRLVGSGASNSVLGTDLTYEDALHFDTVFSAATTRRLDDTLLDGHPAMLLETRPGDESPAYSVIRTFIDRATCVPLKAEFFGPNGSLDKTLSTTRASIRMVNGHAIPTESVMVNHKHRSRSEFTVSAIEVDVELRDQMFTLAEIRKGH